MYGGFVLYYPTIFVHHRQLLMEDKSVVIRGRSKGRPRGKHGHCLTTQGQRRARAMSHARTACPIEQDLFCAARTPVGHVAATPLLDASKQSGCADTFPSVERACTLADCSGNPSSDPVHGEAVPQAEKASTATIPVDVVQKSIGAVRSRRGRPRLPAHRGTLESARRKRRERNRKRRDHPPCDAPTDSIADVK